VVDFSKGEWLCKPQQFRVSPDVVSITTEPDTDLWQRSYYGFRRDNAPALLLQSTDNFTFTAKVSFDYRAQFDQCGVVIYLDSENWFKASVEYETADLARHGSVVTNAGHSDWATSDIPVPEFIWYRLSRRGPDFLIESSLNGDDFKQMRIFHLQALGETTQEMGRHNPPLLATHPVRFGVYACSPSDSSFTATFTEMRVEPCLWLAHA